ncbi:MAG: type II toxin-antitoxin system VapC family toxin [Chloroflexi bacterium]|nr:type II toxin-antitoxin system VapC family toxin [Chloroflexota bacterium]
MPSGYLDSSFLIAYLYEERDDPERFRRANRLIGPIRGGSVEAVVSFYALPELYSYVNRYQPREEVGGVFRASLIQLFSLPISIVPFLDRSELNHLRQRFTISDPYDARHVAAALFKGCDAIIAFDEHFREVSSVIPAYTPDEYLAMPKSSEAGPELG